MDGAKTKEKKVKRGGLTKGFSGLEGKEWTEAKRQLLWEWGRKIFYLIFWRNFDLTVSKQ
jgi:hypothetical protein